MGVALLVLVPGLEVGERRAGTLATEALFHFGNREFEAEKLQICGPQQIADPGQAQELHLACNGEYYVPAPSGARDWKLAPERVLHENRASPDFREEGSGVCVREEKS